MKWCTAAQIAREMKLSPKRVRSILRSRGVMKIEGRYTFPVERKPELKQMIRDARKRATIKHRSERSVAVLH